MVTMRMKAVSMVMAAGCFASFGGGTASGMVSGAAGEAAAGRGAATEVAPDEVKTVVLGHQFGLTYLPFMVMNEKKLVEKQAKALGLEDLKTEYKTFSGPAPINDGILSENVHFGGVGVPPLLTMWDRTKGKLDVKCVASMTCAPMVLTTSRPDIKSVKDFKDDDRIALPSVKVGVQAVTLQMAVAQAFGQENFAKLDKQTVAMSHPDAMTALFNGSGNIVAHFASPPYIQTELKNEKVKISKVVHSYDVLGGKSSFVVAIGTDKFRKENPKAFEAVAKAFEEAQAYINTNKKEAAEIYLKINKGKETVDELVAAMSDPEIEYSVVPKNTYKYADFLSKTGTVKTKPESWKDYCFPHLHDKAGS